jgi:hypothetical protein
MTRHRHEWQPGPASPNSVAHILICATCGIPKPVRTRLVNGCLICLDCRQTLIGWRTDSTGRWHGTHLCGAR